MMALTAGERPASIYYRGGEVRIDVHDAWYLAECARLMAIMRHLHPDRNRQRTKHNTGFRRACQYLRRFQREQQALWYDEFGLNAPRFRKQGLPSVKAKRTRVRPSIRRGLSTGVARWADDFIS